MKKAMRKKGKGWLFWTPRILSILFIVFLALMSLDIFDMKLGVWGTIVGLFMHNIPALVLLVVLLISWKHEIVGGIAFILAGLLYIVWVLMKNPFQWYYLSWIAQISGIAFLIGILFIIGWNKKRKK